MTEGSNVVGTAAIKIVADASEFGDDLQAKIDEVLSKLEAKIKVGPGSVSTTGAAEHAPVVNDTNPSSVAAMEARHAGGGNGALNLGINASFLREQIQGALNEGAFTIRLNVNGNEVNVNTSSHVTSASNPENLRQALPQQLIDGIGKIGGLGQSIDAFHTATRAAMEQMGKTFGTAQPGDVPAQLRDLMQPPERGGFGPDPSQWARLESVQGEGGVPRQAWRGTIRDVMLDAGGGTDQARGLIKQVIESAAQVIDPRNSGHAGLMYRPVENGTAFSSMMRSASVTPAAEMITPPTRVVETPPRAAETRPIDLPASPYADSTLPVEATKADQRKIDETRAYEIRPAMFGTNTVPSATDRGTGLRESDAVAEEDIAYRDAMGGKRGYRRDGRFVGNRSALQGEVQGVPVDLNPVVSRLARGAKFFRDENGQMVEVGPAGINQNGELDPGVTVGDVMQRADSLRRLSNRRNPITLPAAVGPDGQRIDGARVTPMSDEQVIQEYLASQVGGQDPNTRDAIDAWMQQPRVQSALKLQIGAARANAGPPQSGNIGNMNPNGRGLDAGMRQGFVLEDLQRQAAENQAEITRLESQLESLGDKISGGGGSPNQRTKWEDQESRAAGRLQGAYNREANLANKIANVRETADRTTSMTPEEARRNQALSNAAGARSRSMVATGDPERSFSEVYDDKHQLPGVMEPGVQARQQRNALLDFLGVETPEGMSAKATDRHARGEANLFLEATLAKPFQERVFGAGFTHTQRENTSAEPMGRDALLAEIEDAKKRKGEGGQYSEGIDIGFHEDRLARFDADAAAGKTSSVYPLRPETRPEALRAAWQDTIKPITDRLAQLPEDDPQSKVIADAVEKTLRETYQSLVGRTGEGLKSASGNSRQRRDQPTSGIFTFMDESAQEAIDVKESDRRVGGGRTARVANRDRAGQVAGQEGGRFVTRDTKAAIARNDFLRQAALPKTTLEMEADAAEAEAYRALNTSPAGYDPSNPNTLAAKYAAAQTSHSEAGPSNVKARSAELDAIQTQVKAVTSPAREAKANLQRTRQSVSQIIADITGRGATSPEQVLDAMAVRNDVSGDMLREARDVLSVRTPNNMYTDVGGKLIVSPATRDTSRAPMSGDQTQRAYDKLNGSSLGGTPEPNYATGADLMAKPSVAEERASRAATAPIDEHAPAAAGGGAGNRVPPTASGGGLGGPPGKDTYDRMPTGSVVRVWVAGQDHPLEIAGGGGGGDQPANVTARGKAAMERANFEYANSARAEQFVQSRIERMRQAGQTDDQIAQRFRGTPFANLAATMGIGGQGGLGATAGQAARRQRLGLPPIIPDITTQVAQEADQARLKDSAKAERADRAIFRRGFQASLTDFIQAPFFEDQARKIDTFRREAGTLASVRDKRVAQDSRVAQFQEERDTAETVLTSLPANAKKKTRQVAEKDLSESDKALQKQQQILEKLTAQEQAQGVIRNQAEANLPTGADALGNLGIGAAAGGIATAGATVVFQITSQVLSKAEEAVGIELGKLAEKLTGFSQTLTSVTAAVAQSTRDAHGDVRAVATQQALSAGLSASGAQALEATIGQRGLFEGGNKTLQDQIALGRASEMADFANMKGDRGARTGFLQPGGGIPGLTRSTGGVLGSPLWATPSLNEMLVGELPTSRRDETSRSEFAGIVGGIGAGVAGLAHADFGGFINSITSLPNEIMASRQAISEAGKYADSQFEEINKAADRGGSKGQFISGASPEQQAAFRSAGNTIGISSDDIDKYLKDNKVAVGEGGTPISPEELRSLLVAVEKGLTTPDPESILRDVGGRQGAAFVGQIDAQSALQRQMVSTSFAQNYLGSPPMRLEDALFPGGINAGSGKPNMGTAGFGDFSDALIDPKKFEVPQAAFDTYTRLGKTADDVFGQIDSLAQKGIEDLKKTGVSDQDIAKLTQYGGMIRDLQKDAAGRQMAAATEDYNYNLGLAKRTVGDLLGLTGQTSAKMNDNTEVLKTNLGIQERIVLTKSRELTLLGQELTQRQINFRIAAAGFGTQGGTGAERAAINRQAQYEASIAQKQLDLQKGITGAQFKIVDEQNLRAFNEAVRSVGKMIRDNKISFDIAGDKALITALETLKGEVLDQSNITIARYKSMEDFAISTAATMRQETDESFTSLLDRARKTIAVISSEYQQAIGATPGTPSPTKSNDDRHDTGGGGSFLPSKTSSTGSTSITFGDVYVQNQADITNLANQVERVLDRKSALLGLRAPVGS